MPSSLTEQPRNSTPTPSSPHPYFKPWRQRFPSSATKPQIRYCVHSPPRLAFDPAPPPTSPRTHLPPSPHASPSHCPRLQFPFRVSPLLTSALGFEHTQPPAPASGVRPARAWKPSSRYVLSLLEGNYPLASWNDIGQRVCARAPMLREGDARMCQRGYGRGYCAVIERSRGVGYRWVLVDSLGTWKLGVEGRWKEGRTYAHCRAGLTASWKCD